MKLGNLIRFETRAGEPLQVGALTLTPESQVLAINSPFGGYVWNRARALVVEDGDDRQEIAIVDATRGAQLALFAAAALFTLLGWLIVTK